MIDVPVEDVVSPSGNTGGALRAWRLNAWTNNNTTSYFISAKLILNTPPGVFGVPSDLSFVEDVAGNIDLSSATFTDSEDNALTVTLTASAGTLAATSAGGVTVTGSGSGTLTLAGLPAALNTFLDTASNIRYTTPADGPGPYTLTVSASDGTEGLASNPAVTLNVTPTPDVTTVSAAPPSGFYKAGDTVAVDVTFDMAATVAPGATLLLETGAVDRVATSAGGTGSTARFAYVVQHGDTAADLDYAATSALSGTITGNGHAADLTLPARGATGSLGATSAVVIDTIAPVVTDGRIGLSGASGSGGTFIVGDTVTASWDASGGDGDTNLGAGLGSVSIDFSAFGGGAAVPAGLSGSVWSASYTIVAGSSTTGTNLDVAVTATDAAGNAATTSDTTDATVDATPPVVRAAHIARSGATGTGGTFRIGDTVTATWDNSAAGDGNDDIHSATFDFTDFGGGPAVAATHSAGIWTASHTITAGAIDGTSRNLRVTALDLAGNRSSPVGGGNASVDNVAPAVADGEIAVSGGTGPGGAFRIGDPVTVAWTSANTDAIDVVTVDFSAFGGPAAAPAAQGGSVWTATHILPAGTLSSSGLPLSVTALDNAANPLTTTKATVYTANTIAPGVVVTGPTEIVTERFTVEIAFSEDVAADLDASEIRVTNGTVAEVAPVPGASSRFTARIDPVLGNSVVVQVLADAVTSDAGGNPNTASNAFTVFAGSVASAFDDYRAEIRQVLVDDAERSLRSVMATNQRMMRGARERFEAAAQQRAACLADPEASAEDPACEIGPASRNSVPFDIVGGFAISGHNLDTRGTFHGETGVGDGSVRRLYFGDFDIRHDGGTGSTTATVTGRMAWERMAGERTMLGYFVGGELARTDIDGTFDGTQDRLGVTVGGYVVRQLTASLFADGLLTLGAGRNDLRMANDVLALESDYTTRTATIRAAVSGAYAHGRLEFRPELAISYGRTWIGDVRFSGRAYGLSDDSQTLDAGVVSVASVTLRPEAIWSLDGDASGDGTTRLSVAPRLLCDRVIATVRTSDCGGGIEVGVGSRSRDGLRNADVRVVMDRVGGRTRSSVALGFEQRF